MPRGDFRRSGFGALATLACLCSCGPGSRSDPGEVEARRPPSRPPVILISIDTLRSDRLPSYGYDGIETPGIDALARDSILFERAYCQVPLTTPSHASILTGLLPPQHGVRDNIGYRFDTLSVPYLPDILQRAGYATGAAVSSYSLRGAVGFRAGFDFYEDDIQMRARAGLGGLQRRGDQTLRAALGWLRGVADGPFFFFFHLFEPHTPYAPPEPFASRYLSPYDGEVAAADLVVGRLVDELKHLGVYDRAIVILLSDHGEGLGDHGEEEHGILLYRESLQVPLLLKLPRSESAGSRVATPAQLIDVVPTLVSLLGLPPIEHLPGVSLLELLDPASPVRSLYAETYYPRLHFGWSELASLIEDRLHLIEGPEPELFDLVSDFGETRNLIRAERRSTARLRSALAGFERRFTPPSEVDEETRQRLAALGYVGAAVSEPGESLPDPRSRLHTVEDLKDGMRYYARGEFAQAVDSYRKALALNPRALDAWEYLGRSLSGLGRHQEALDAYREAFDLSGATHLVLAEAQTLAALGRLDESLDRVQAHLPTSPEDKRLRMLEARTLILLNRLDDALERAEELLRIAPDSADALYLRGAVQIGRGSLTDAERDLRQALEIAPDHIAAMSDLAVLLQHRGDLAGARALLERALILRPGDPVATRNLQALDQRSGAMRDR